MKGVRKMKYNVKFSCGHKETVQLFGKTSDRERRIKYFEEQGLCSECYKEQKKIDAEIEAEKAGLVVKDMSYREYKQNYADCKTVPGSYNGETKSIKVYIAE
jgi:hypothetical protein